MSSITEPQVVARQDGGAIVIGIDRSGAPGVQIRAFGFDPNGGNAWSSYPSGLVLATYPSYIGAGGGTGITGAISDSLGGAYVAVNSGGVASAYGIDLYRVGGAGVIPAGWSSGVHVSGIVGQSAISSLACAGGSGVFIGWSHITSTSTTFYMQHLRVDGTIGAGWVSDGKAILSAGHVIVRGTITSDLTGGVYGMFLDGGNQRAYVTHFDSTGTPVNGWSATGVDASPDHAGSVIGSSILTEIVPDGEGGAIAGWNANFDSPYPTATRLIHLGPTQVVPTRLSLVSTLATPSLVTLEWYTATATGETFELQRSQDSGTWTTLGEVTANGVGLLDFSDTSILPGARFGYRLRTTGSAVYVASAETWVDVPVAYRFALTGARPNPAPRNDAAIAFSRTTNAAATLEMFDLAGRRVLSRDVGSLGAGDHVLRLGSDARLEAGMYWLRLAQGTKTASVRLAVTE
jgi:hypothetical protein